MRYILDGKILLLCHANNIRHKKKKAKISYIISISLRVITMI